MNHRIHQTPDERLANTAEAHLQATQDNTQEVRGVREAVDNLHRSSQDKSHEEAIVNGVNGTTQKLEEIKSAHLMTNKLLKDIREKEHPASTTNVNIELPNKQNELAVAFFSMLKGEKGDTPTAAQLIPIIKPLIPPLIPDPIKGDKGDSYVLTDKDKKDIARSVHVPVVEKVIERREVIKEQPIVTNEIKEVAMKDTPDELVDKLHKSSKKIHPSRIHGLEHALRAVDDYGKNPQGIGGGANQIIVKNQGTRVSDYITEIDFTTNLTATYSNNGKVTLTASSGGAASLHTETPTGLINGSNKVYTTTTAIATVIGIWSNGQYIHPSEYVVAGAGFTMNTALDSSLSGLGFTISYAS